MLEEEEKDIEQEEGKIEVEESESEPSPPIEGAIESDQAANEANVNVAEDQELKVLPESEEEREKEIIVAADAAKKSLPRATTTDPKRKYHRIVDLPPEADIETARSTYNYGILEITFSKREETKPKGNEVKVE